MAEEIKSEKEKSAKVKTKAEKPALEKAAKPTKEKAAKPTKKAVKKEEKKLAPVKLKLLVTVVNHKKADFYVDLLQGYQANLQMVLSGRGTASNETLRMLGLTDNEKSVILSIVREDMMENITRTLEEKFNTVNDGKGVAYTIPLSSTVGVAIYRFLSNTKKE